MRIANVMLAAVAATVVASAPVTPGRISEHVRRADEQTTSKLIKRVLDAEQQIQLLGTWVMPGRIIEKATQDVDSSVAQLSDNLKLKDIDSTQAMKVTSHENGADRTPIEAGPSRGLTSGPPAQLASDEAVHHSRMLNDAHTQAQAAEERRLLDADPVSMSKQELMDAYRFLRPKYDRMGQSGQQDPRGIEFKAKINAITAESLAREAKTPEHSGGGSTSSSSGPPQGSSAQLRSGMSRKLKSIARARGAKGGNSRRKPLTYTEMPARSIYEYVQKQNALQVVRGAPRWD